MRFRIFLLISAFSIFMFKDVHAYSVKNHMILTVLAVEAYNHCGKIMPEKPRGFEKIRPLEKYRLVNGNISEDEDKAGKLKRWHFYDRAGQLGRDSIVNIFGFSGLIETPSLHARFDQLEIRADKQGAFVESHRRWRLYDVVGAMMHYIQDVTVPAHVVPIFHPKNFLGDAFDRYEVRASDYRGEDIDRLEATEEFLSQFDALKCRRVFREAERSYNQILNALADETYLTLENKIPDSPLTWSEAFWDRKRNSRGFGDYGRAGNRFGKRKSCLKKKDVPEINRDACGDRLQVIKAVYDQFSGEQHLAAIEGSMRAIALLQSRFDDGQTR